MPAAITRNTVRMYDAQVLADGRRSPTLSLCLSRFYWAAINECLDNPAWQIMRGFGNRVKRMIIGVVTVSNSAC
jgi:hypothetical protein